ncbi:family 78 glycoside hydrolase catalytic domain [Herbiconiux sp. A18JL235]|uniref:alpha-L-rhamnosidase n=1 Tax=Herbiconiux sp. A18JL235 TaxID=3152363 RepID=A0AB39BG62_9MICO
MSPSNLRVEHTVEPVGVDVSPRFSWYGSGAWRLDVAGPGGPLWSASGTGRPAPEVEYDGPALSPLTRYRWSVTTNGSSTSSAFVTGVLDGDWRGARFVGHAHPSGAAPLLRREFTAPTSVAEAYLVVAAGGYARVAIDGTLVEPSVLSPGFTDYDVTAQYTVTDVTPLLAAGRRHAIGLELGRGFYGMAAPNTWNWETAPWHAEPSARLLLVIRDEQGAEHVVTTDASWRAIDGPTRYDDLHGGEDHDARREPPGWDAPGFDDHDWDTAWIVAGPRGRPVHQRQPAVEVAERFDPDSIVEIAPGRWVLAFPRVIAGWLEIEAEGAAGEVIELRHGERLRSDGSVDTDDPLGYFAGRFQLDRVVLAGAPVSWRPRFVYHGFQYAEVRAARLPRVRAALVHTRAPRTGSFGCDDALLETVHELTARTVLNNLHGIPTDTPMLEKNGWTGDGMVGARLMLQNLDVHELLAKWCADIAASRHGSGAPTVLAPDGGWTMDWSPAPTWHAALVLIPWELWMQRGDRRVLVDLWADASDYLRFELARTVDGIADTTLGDWVSPETSAGGGNAPEDTRIAATAFLVAMLDVLAEWATELGEPAGEWRDAAARSRAAFVARFVRDGIVAGDGDEGFRQAHGVLALAFDLLPEPLRQGVADSVAADVRARGDHLSTGALATKHLLPQLTRFGHADAALAVARQTTFPSWGFWVAQGATSLWEHWKPESRSRGHYFLGTVDDWLFAEVAGLSPLAPGWRRALIAPRVLEVGGASASVETPYGTLAVRWAVGDDGHVELDATVPEGVTATLCLPGTERELASGRHGVRSHQAVYPPSTVTIEPVM